MYNKSLEGTLRLFDGACAGETKDMSVHTPQTEDTGEQEMAPVAEEQTAREREERFRALMEGEYKDLFTAYFQETFNRRFKEHKSIKQELQEARAVIAAAAERFGTSDSEALLAAIRVEKDENTAPTEAAQPPADPLPEQALLNARAEAQRILLEDIRARGLRPTEGALGAAVAKGIGVGRLTRAERAELARRAAKGEQIVF